MDTLKSYSYARSWNINEINAINSFLDGTKEDDSIFTVGITLVLDSQKDIVFNITHYGVYDSIKCYKNQLFPTLKCLDDLGILFENRSIKYVIGDQRTMRLINGYDKLKIPFNNNYIPIKKISTPITIYGLSS